MTRTMLIFTCTMGWLLFLALLTSIFDKRPYHLAMSQAASVIFMAFVVMNIDITADIAARTKILLATGCLVVMSIGAYAFWENYRNYKHEQK